MKTNPTDPKPKTPPAAGFCQVIACLIMIPAVLGPIVAITSPRGFDFIFFAQCAGLLALSAFFFALGRIVILLSEIAHH